MVPKKQHARTKTSQLSSARSAKRTSSLDCTIHQHDLSQEIALRLSSQPIISIDTETSGLDYRVHKLCWVTIYMPHEVHIIQKPDRHSLYLDMVLRNSACLKVFHHMLFDLQFIKAWTGFEVSHPIGCTKTLMKILRPDSSSGLGSAIKNVLGIQINKAIDHSRWDHDKLNARQKDYICNDVRYLPQLMQTLISQARPGNLDRYHDIISTIRNKAYLEVEGYIDILDYPQASQEQKLQYRNWWAKQSIGYKGTIC